MAGWLDGPHFIPCATKTGAALIPFSAVGFLPGPAARARDFGPVTGFFPLKLRWVIESRVRACWCESGFQALALQDSGSILIYNVLNSQQVWILQRFPLTRLISVVRS
jgi:hypothetical protein